jgi:hypothetical protein
MIASTFFIARPDAFYARLRFGNVSPKSAHEKKMAVRPNPKTMSNDLLMRSSGLLAATRSLLRCMELASNDTINIQDRRVVVCGTRLAYDSPRYVPFLDPMN